MPELLKTMTWDSQVTTWDSQVPAWDSQVPAWDSHDTNLESFGPIQEF